MHRSVITTFGPIGFLSLAILLSGSPANGQQSIEDTTTFSCSVTSGSSEINDVWIEVETQIAVSPNWENCTTGNYQVYAAWSPVPGVVPPYYSVLGNAAPIYLGVNETRLNVANVGGVTVGNNCGGPGCPCSGTDFWDSVQSIVDGAVPLVVSAFTATGSVGKTCEEVESLPPFCGDAKKDPLEECDEGPIGGDCCAGSCQWRGVKPKKDVLGWQPEPLWSCPPVTIIHDPNFDYSVCTMGLRDNNKDGIQDCIDYSACKLDDDANGDGFSDCLIDSTSDGFGSDVQKWCVTSPNSGGSTYEYAFVVKPAASSQLFAAGKCDYPYGFNENLVQVANCRSGKKKIVGETLWRTSDDKDPATPGIQGDANGIVTFTEYKHDTETNETRWKVQKRHPNGLIEIVTSCTTRHVLSEPWVCE